MELEVREFRGIKRMESPLKLEKLTILVGKNNVGKSALLEALYILSWPFYETLKIPPYEATPLRHLVNIRGEGAALIYGYSGTAEVDFRSEGGLIQVRLRKEESEVLLDGKSATPDDYLGKVGRGWALYIPNHTPTFNMISDYVVQNIAAIEKERLHVKAAELISYDGATEVTVRWDELYIRRLVEDTPLYVGVKALGEGAKRAILVFLTAEHLRPKLLLWDDIETAMHPGLTERVIRWLVDAPWTTVVTTHSIDVLYQVAILAPRAKVVVVKKERDDTLKFKEYNVDELGELFKANIDVRKIADELEL